MSNSGSLFTFLTSHGFTFLISTCFLPTCFSTFIKPPASAVYQLRMGQDVSKRISFISRSSMSLNRI